MKILRGGALSAVREQLDAEALGVLPAPGVQMNRHQLRRVQNFEAAGTSV